MTNAVISLFHRYGALDVQENLTVLHQRRRGSIIRGIYAQKELNTVHSSPVIDKETYDRYKDLEEKYGADLEVYIDEMGRYRGGLPRVGSVDATHISGAQQGFSATSLIKGYNMMFFQIKT